MLIIPILLLRLGWLLLTHIKYWKNLRTGLPTTPNQIMSMSLRMFPGEFLLYTVGWAQTARQTLVYRHRPFLSRDQELKQLHLNDVKEMFKKRFPFKLLISFIRVWSIQLDLISIHTHPARFAFSELNSPLSCTDISYFTFHLFNDEFHVQFTVLLSLVLCFPWLEDCPHFLFPRCYRRRLLTHLKPHLGNFRSINPRIFPCVPPRCQRFQFPNALLKHTHEKVGMFISSAFSNCL